MKYSTKLAETITKNDVSFLDAGIHENIKLVNVRIDKTTNDTTFLELTFENEEGKQLKQTEFEPSRYPGSDDAAWDRTIAIKISRLMDYLYLYYAKGTLHNEANTYAEFVQWVANLLNAADKNNTLLRIKAVYQANGFVTLPRYSDKTFIERMDVPKSNIVKIARDIFERPTLPNNEDSKTFLETKLTPSNEDELPFK